MSKIGEFELLSHGFDNSQYFQGCGTSFTKFENVVTGCGSNPSEAIEDCLEQIAQQGYEVESLSGRILQGEGWEEFPDTPDVESYLREENPSEYVDDDGEFDGDGCEIYFYVSIRWNDRAQIPAGELATLDEFTRAYLETALWSSHDNLSSAGGDPLDKHFAPEDLAPATLAQAIADCATFQADNGELLAQAYGDDTLRVNNNGGRWGGSESAGHDFWLTRNGHGAGFWDGDWGAYGDKLTQASKAHGERDFIIGDDGLIYS